MEHPNAQLYRQLMAAVQAGDVKGVTQALSPDLRWYEAGSPEVLGRDAVVQRLGAVSQDLTGRVDLHDVLADDDHVVAMLRVALCKPDGSEVDYPAVEVAHLVDGRITERWSFMDACPPDVTAFFAGRG
jgi:ketosteroid isomerase-like protein